MKKFTLPLVISILAILTASCTKNETTAKSMEQLYKENGVPVKVETVAKKPLTNNQTFHATLSGIKESNASAMVADKVEKIRYSVGDYVKKDAVVITFPTDNPSAQYQQAQAGFELAKATRDRMKNLYEQGGISLQDYEGADTQYKVQKANWEAVQQTVNVKAPISGTITQINVQESDNVNPGDNLFTISQTNKLKTKVWVSEDQVVFIKNGDMATATWGGQELVGAVTQVDLSLNSHQQAFGVVVEFDNPANAVKSGVNAEIEIESKLGDSVLVINRKNLVTYNKKPAVFTLNNGSAKLVAVELGQTVGTDVEIINGLNIGDQLITEGQLLLKDGAQVNVAQ